MGGSAPSYTPPAATPSGLTAEERLAQERQAALEKARLKARKGFASTLLAGTAELGGGGADKKTLLGS